MMRKPILIVVSLVVLLVASAPAPAGEEHGHGTADKPRYSCEADLQSCLDWMAKHYSERGWAGMQLDVEEMIFTVTEIHEGSPAAKAGIRAGDLLVAVNGVEINEENQEKLIQMQQQMKPGAQFTYTLKRDGKRRNVDFVLVEMPYDTVAVMIGMHLLEGHVAADVAHHSDSD